MAGFAAFFRAAGFFFFAAGFFAALTARFGGKHAAPAQPEELVSPRRNRPQGPWDQPQSRKPGPWG